MTLSNKWVHRFTKLAHEVSTWSVDSTGVGAIIVGEEKNIISTGFNGAPRGVEETEIRKNQHYKKYFIEHAERNAIFLAKSSLKGAILFTTHFPCADCARAIIQEGIREVYYCQKMEKEHWKESMMASEIMLTEAKVKLHKVNYTPKCSFVVEKSSKTKNFSATTSILSECRLPTTVQSSMEGQQVQIHWDTPGGKTEVYAQKDIFLTGTTLTLPMRALNSEETEHITTQMQDSIEIKK